MLKPENLLVATFKDGGEGTRFEWLPAEDRGPRFLEETEAKFDLVKWAEDPEEGGEEKRKLFLALAGAEIRNKVKQLQDTGNDYDTLINKLKDDLLADEPLIYLI